ncbi:MAG: response regulator transcription factor [Gemmatimonadales bacterium]
MTRRSVHHISALDPSIRLTARRLAVVSLLRDGLIEKEVARRLGISLATVAEHIATAKRKLSARTSAQLVSEAIRHGFLSAGSMR